MLAYSHNIPINISVTISFAPIPTTLLVPSSPYSGTLAHLRKFLWCCCSCLLLLVLTTPTPTYAPTSITAPAPHTHTSGTDIQGPASVDFPVVLGMCGMTGRC